MSKYYAAREGWSHPQSALISEQETDEKTGETRIVAYHGTYMVGEFRCKFGLRRQKNMPAAEYQWRGQISVLARDGYILKAEGDIRRQIEKKWASYEKELGNIREKERQTEGEQRKAYAEKREKEFFRKRKEALNASMDLHCRNASEEELKVYIARCAMELCQKHIEAIRMDFQRSDAMSHITLLNAWMLLQNTFMKNYSGSSERYQKEFKEGIQRIVVALSGFPMEKIHSAMVSRIVADRGGEKNVIRDLRYAAKFWNFCLRQRYCIGANPIEQWLKKYEKTDAVDPEAIFRSVSQLVFIPTEKEQELNQYLELQYPDPLARALLLAKENGVVGKELAQLQVKDLEFQEHPLRIFIRRTRNYVGSATQDYLVPATPFCAYLLKKWYDDLRQQNPGEEIENYYVCGEGTKPASAKKIGDYVRRVLCHWDILPKQDGRQQLFTFRLLQENYLHRLTTYCGLREEPGTVNYLMGRSLSNDTTADHYRCFTDPEGQEMLYRALARDRRFFHQQEEDEMDGHDGGNTFFPEAPDKRLYIKAQVKVQGGSFITLESPTGVRFTCTRRA